MMTKLVPLGNRVLLRRIESSTRGGLRLPQSSEIDEGTQEYEVAALGSAGAMFIAAANTDSTATVAMPLAVGDRIYLARHKGWKIETNSGEELYVAEVDDILAVEVDVETGFPGGGHPQVACRHHKTGEDTGELHEPHSCPECGAFCSGDSPCIANEVRL